MKNFKGKLSIVSQSRRSHVIWICLITNIRKPASFAKKAQQYEKLNKNVVLSRYKHIIQRKNIKYKLSLETASWLDDIEVLLKMSPLQWKANYHSGAKFNAN